MKKIWGKPRSRKDVEVPAICSAIIVIKIFIGIAICMIITVDINCLPWFVIHRPMIESATAPSEMLHGGIINIILSDFQVSRIRAQILFFKESPFACMLVI